MHDLIKRKLSDIQHLCAKRRVRRLAAFGSAIGGRFSPQSDLDFVVEFAGMSARDRADAYFGLLEDLEMLLGRPVDLIEASAIRNPYFRTSVEQTQVELYAAA